MGVKVLALVRSTYVLAAMCVCHAPLAMKPVPRGTHGVERTPSLRVKSHARDASAVQVVHDGKQTTHTRHTGRCSKRSCDKLQAPKTCACGPGPHCSPTAERHPPAFASTARHRAACGATSSATSSPDPTKRGQRARGTVATTVGISNLGQGDAHYPESGTSLTSAA